MKLAFFLALPHTKAGNLDHLGTLFKGVLIEQSTHTVEEVEYPTGIWILTIPRKRELASATTDLSEKATYVFTMRRVDTQGPLTPKMLGYKASTAESGLWDMWCIHPSGLDLNGDGKIDRKEWLAGTAIFRKLARFRLNNKNITLGGTHILGPWSAKKLQKLFGDAVDCVLYPREPKDTQVVKGRLVVNSWTFNKAGGIRLPWVYAGEIPEDLAKVDYDPTQDDINRDVVATEPKPILAHIDTAPKRTKGTVNAQR